ncbi:MAG: hypothetical protein ACYSU7_04880 [Planctomycetota bacterium]
MPGINEAKFAFPMQMIQKDGDFDQVGELLNVWLMGHELHYDSVGVYDFTQRTFSEYMHDALTGSPTTNRRVNRLRTQGMTGTPVPATLPGGGQGTFADDPMHLVPAMPAAARLFDAFVCDGKGQLLDFDEDGIAGFDVDGFPLDPDDAVLWEEQWFLNANGFRGVLTPGLLNLNTASREALRAVPNWFRLVHEFWSPDISPYVNLPGAIVQYRDRLGMYFDDFDWLPAYADRGRRITDQAGLEIAPGYFHTQGLRSDRGIASPGELLLLGRGGKRGKVTTGVPGSLQIRYDPIVTGVAARDNILFNSSFRIDYPTVPERAKFVSDGGALPPDPNYPYLFQEEDPNNLGDWNASSAHVTADVVDVGMGNPAGGPRPRDDVAEDVEEANMLLAGASNMITTRSDVFTVYFRVRSFRQNPVTGVWDATDREAIVEENRYVMLVDRSQVNRPSDRPRILYYEQLPP